jgi:FtsP/CotA-like multicopper oxidase with cupredoxin domain
MEPISRRAALQLTVLGVASAVVGGAGLWRASSPSPGATGASAGELVEPRVLASANGVLAVELLAAGVTVEVGGRAVRALGYNGTVPGPTWRVRPGDRLQVTLVNELDHATNLHTHGLFVSPDGNGDNPFVAVQPGQRFDYDIQLPEDHPPGLFWYHPHHHGTVADQVFAGLYGAIIVEDPTEPPVTRERVLVVSDITIDVSGDVAAATRSDRMMGREGETVLVNGQVRPVLRARPGERERWRVVNACVSRHLDLRVPGQDLALLGMDSARTATPTAVDRVILAPGNRADLIVQTTPGSAEVLAVPVDRGAPMGMMMGGGPTSGATVTLARLEVDGAPAGPLDPLPSQPAPRDLAGVDVARRRELTLTMGMGMGMGGGMSFTIDGKEFDPDRIDENVTVGDVEEWTLVNTSPMDHPFHLHVWPMQVLREGTRTPEDVTRRDVVSIPAQGSTVVRIPFDRYAGRTVYHCHILDHEDLGMMGVIQAT